MENIHRVVLFLCLCFEPGSLEDTTKDNANKPDPLQDTIYLSFKKDNIGPTLNFSCDDLSVSGYTILSVPEQAIPSDTTCSCLLQDTLFVAVESTDINKHLYCDSHSCSETQPDKKSANVHVKINAQHLEVHDEMGNVFKYVKPMEKTVSIQFSFFQDEDVKCSLEKITPTSAPPLPPQPSQTPQTTIVNNDHSHSFIIIALVGSVIINVVIIIIAVFSYHKLNSRQIKKKMPYMVTAAIQRQNSRSSPFNRSNSTGSRRPPTSPGTGYTPLGRLNPVSLPSGMEIYNSNSEAPTDDEMYTTSYAPCNRNLAPPKYNYNKLLKSNAASMSDVSSIAPSTGSSNLADSTTRILSSSTGNLHSRQQPGTSSASNLDIQVPVGAAGTIDKQVAPLPALPRQVTVEVMRNISRTSNSYDYIEYDALPRSDLPNREASHKYLQIT